MRASLILFVWLPLAAAQDPKPCPEGYEAKPKSVSVDERPPKLRRGKPPEYDKTEQEAPPATNPDCVWTEVAVSPDGTVLAHLSRSPDFDPFIEQVRQQVASFSDTLPNYICEQHVTRFAGNNRPLKWKRKDRLTVEVLYIDGIESYQNVTRNGKKVK
ncbi:MAG: hypothetical protein GY953_33005, partial [bacterium]|nr:hypothetical protein [bacterium]